MNDALERSNSSDDSELLISSIDHSIADSLMTPPGFILDWFG